LEIEHLQKGAFCKKLSIYKRPGGERDG